MCNLIIRNDKVLGNTREVALSFGKQHKNILAKIDRTIEEWSKDNELKNKLVGYFLKSSYIDEKGEYRKEYLLTRDGFSFLVMGFTGKKADKWKVKYIDMFNRMESALREKQSTEWKKTRIKGKLTRRSETDAISQYLIPLAIDQGSKNSGKLYMNYSKLVNNSIGIPPKSRGLATRRVLNTVETMETLIEKVITEESIKGTYYKDIYKICKAKCILLAELSCLPEQKLLN